MLPFDIEIRSFSFIVVLLTLPGPHRHIYIEMVFAVLNTPVCCPWDIVREDQRFLALQKIAVGGFALWHFLSVTYGVVVAVLVVPQVIVNYYLMVLSLMSTLSLI